MTPRNIVRVGATVTATLMGLGAMGGTAYAVWTSSGTGTGTAAAGVMLPVTTSIATVTTGLLYPGATGDVEITINNPNPFPVVATDITNVDPITSDKGPTCDAATGVSFNDVTGAALAVLANSSQTFTLTNAVTMDNSSDDTCQGAIFTIPVTLVAASS